MIKDAPFTGAHNMAFDAYLLENPPAVPVLRFYSWNPPAVSLGYHQRIPEYDKTLFDTYGIDLVRRPTGGRAVFHCQEVTYAVVIPKSSEWFSCTIHQLYFHISRVITESLQRLNIPAAIEWNTSKKTKTGFTPNECFASIARFEIKKEGQKMVGSAQRRMSKAILQHGSILLVDEQYILEPLLQSGTGVEDVFSTEKSNRIVSADTAREDIIQEIINGFENNFGCQWIADFDFSAFREKERMYMERYSIYKSRLVPSVLLS